MTELEPRTTITTILTANDRISTKLSCSSDKILSGFNRKERELPQFQVAAEEFAAKHGFRVFACGEIVAGYIWLCERLPEKPLPYEVGDE